MKKWIDSENGKSTVNELYNTGIIQSLYKDGKWRLGPSYISAHDFVSDLFEYIHGDKPIPTEEKKFIELIDQKLPGKPPIKDALLAFYKQAVVDKAKEAQNAFIQTRQEIEKWFDSVMERLSGYYKRKIYWIGMGVAFLISSLMNIDSIAIVESLWDNQHLHNTIVAIAINYSQANLEVAQTDKNLKETLEEVQKAFDIAGEAVEDLQDRDLPILWVTGDDPGEDPYNQNLYHVVSEGGLIGKKLVGVILSAFAASQGSQIWFDMLKTLINVRGSGPKQGERDKKE